MPVATAVVADVRVAAGIVLATRDMAAERRRAAALDRTHHLHLVEADVPAIGFTPCGTVVAEDLRDLQRRTHRRRLWRGLLLGLALHATCGWQRQLIERALDGRNQTCRHPRVARRRLGLVVAENRLDHAEVRAALEHARGEAVAQRVQRDRLLEAGRLGRLLEQPVKLTRREPPMLAASGEQPAASRRDSRHRDPLGAPSTTPGAGRAPLPAA